MSALPGALDFGPVATNASNTQTVAVYNTGDVPLDVTDASISGPDAAAFSVVTQQNLCPARLAAGGSCTLQVQFAPSTVAPAQATLLLSSDNAATNPSVAIALSGSGTAPATPASGTNGSDGTNGANGPTGRPELPAPPASPARAEPRETGATSG